MKNLILTFLTFTFYSLNAKEIPCDPQVGIQSREAEKLAVESQQIVKILTSKDFYKKRLEGTIPVKASENASDAALRKANETVTMMLSKREDIRRRLLRNKAEIAIIAPGENYCDLPEAKSLADKQTKDPSKRGFCTLCGAGAVPGRPITAICEDNLLKTAKDPYFHLEDILTHEFAHTMHILGLSANEKQIIARNYNKAVAEKIFDVNAAGIKTYIIEDDKEFFACLSAAWFGVHNPHSPSMSPDLVNRNSIKEKLPEMYELLKSIYPE